MSEWKHQNPFHESVKQPEKSIWSFFDQYKTNGVGKALSRPVIASFHHISDETRMRDQKLLAQKMNKKNITVQRLEGPDAFAFENFLTTEAITHGWFGGKMSPTTEYDDWISGVDAYVEWQGSDDVPVRMAIDFTATANHRVFTKKSEKLEKDCRVKYLRSGIERVDGLPKELSASMPIVILGADEKIFKLIAEQGKDIDDRHPMRRLLVEQAISQITLQCDALRERYESFYNVNVQDLSVTNQKELNRYKMLVALQSELEKEKHMTDTIELDPTWRTIIQSSVTHSVLST